MKINLEDLAYALEKSDALTGYVDLDTGRVVLAGEDFSHAAAMADESDAAQLEHALSIEDDWQRYVALPNACDVDMKAILRAFALTVEDAEKKAALLAALEGMGAVTRGERLVRRLEMAAAWRRYLHAYFVAIARDWCEENGIAYEE